MTRTNARTRWTATDPATGRTRTLTMHGTGHGAWISLVNRFGFLLFSVPVSVRPSFRPTDDTGRTLTRDGHTMTLAPFGEESR